MVSASNFLTIAFGAWLLPLPEQAKLIYVYTSYIALVLVNAATLFAAAPILRDEVPDPHAYRRHLLLTQIVIALAAVIVVDVVFSAYGSVIEWQPTVAELLGLSSFLLIQQFADFNRRAEYVFGLVAIGAGMSVIALVLRVGGLLVVQPDNAQAFMVVLALSSLPGAVAAFWRGAWSTPLWWDRRLLKQHISIARWSMASAPLRWSGLHLPIFLVGALSGAAPAAILASIRSLSTFANVFLELFETYIPSWMARRRVEAGLQAVKAAAIKLYVLGVAGWTTVFIVLLFFGDRLIGVALGPEYSQYSFILVILWIGNGVTFLVRVANIRHRVEGRSFLEFVGVIAGVMALVLTIPLVNMFGPLGGAWSIVLIQLSSVAAIMWFATKRSP